MEIRIIEKAPDSRNSINGIFQWIRNKGLRADNMTPVWTELESLINDSVKYEFSEANPNSWPAISESWKQEKMEQGKPVTIGIYTGALKRAASDDAIIKKSDVSLYWGLNEDVNNDFGELVGNYAADFNETRPLFQYTGKYIKSVIKKTIQQWLRWGEA
jgi:hypothetical protein